MLLILALIHYQDLGQTTIDRGWQWLACAVLVIGILAQSGGYFLHMAVGQDGQPSSGTLLTTIGAVMLALALLVLAYGLLWANPS